MITARHEYMDRPTLKSDLACDDPSLTKQSDLKDCDINSIFKKYERTGQLPDLIVKNGRYGDFTSVPDYQEALNIIQTASEQFNALSVEIRNRFANDPAQFLAFATDSRNMDELEKMGLLKPEVVKARKDARDAEYRAKDLAAREAEKTKPAQ